MQCILRQMMAIALIMFSAVTYAQQNFFTNTNTPSAATSTSTKTSGGTRAPVMTPEQFKQSINKVSQQTDKNITDQLDKKIIKTPSLPPAPPAAPTDNSSNFSIDNSQPAQTPAAAPQQPAYGAQQPAQIQPIPGQRPPAPAPGTTPPNSTLQPAAPAQGGYYPGFGTGKGNTSGSSSGGNQNQNGGWNIQY